MAILSNNVYIIINREKNSNKGNVVLDIAGGSSANGTHCHIWNELDTKDAFNQRWLLKAVDGHSDVYTLRNLRSGTYLDLDGGSSSDGKQVVGWPPTAGTSAAGNQQWKITPDGAFYRFQNVAGGTYLDVSGNRTGNGARIHGWQRTSVTTQNWSLLRVSRTGREIRKVISRNPYIGKDVHSYLHDGMYVILPKALRSNLYNKTGLHSIGCHPQIFDADSYAFVLKGEVAKWGQSFLRADNFNLLWGVMFGRRFDGSVHAYNWYLNDDLDAIRFFKPLTGEEVTTIDYPVYLTIF